MKQSGEIKASRNVISYVNICNGNFIKWIGWWMMKEKAFFFNFFDLGVPGLAQSAKALKALINV